jgi:hypothetical protein
VNAPSFIADYFSAEKLGALLFIGTGIVALGVTLWLLVRRSGLRGMAVSLAAIALLELGVGGAVWLRSDAQSAQLQQQAVAQPAQFRADESTRMRRVIGDLALYRNIQIGVLALGMALVVALRRSRFWFAFGVGLVLQAAALLALDHVAAARAQAYFQAVLRG